MGCSSCQQNNHVVPTQTTHTHETTYCDCACGCNEPVCPTPQPCTEITDSKCIVYTDLPIKCGNTTVVTTNASVSTALNQIVDYFCNNSGGGTTALIEGEGIDITETTVGGVTNYTIAQSQKDFFYLDVQEPTLLFDDPNYIFNQYFVPSTYSSLEFTNSAAVAKTYKINVSFEYNSPDVLGNEMNAWIDMALYKSDGITETKLYEKLSQFDLSVNLFYGTASNQQINGSAPVHTLTDDQGSLLTTKWYNTIVPGGGTFFYALELDPNESVFLKFKSKSGTSTLAKAQLMVEEIYYNI